MSSNIKRIFSENGKLTNPTDLSPLVKSAIDSGNPILLWFHGGLVGKKDGEKIANFVGDFLLKKDFDPTFLIWDSGVGPSLRDGLAALLKRKLVHGVETIVTGFIRFKNSGEATAFAMSGESTESIDRRMLERAAELNPDLQVEAQSLRAEGQQLAADGDRDYFHAVVEGSVVDADFKLDALIRQKVQEDSAARGMNLDIGAWLFIKKFVVDVAFAVFRRYPHRHHGLGQTIVEEAARQIEIGKDVWDAIKADAKANFAAKGACAELIKVLEKNKAALANREIYLVGHSTGAIIIEHWLKASAEAKLGLKYHVRLLAAASRCDSMSGTLKEHSKQVKSIRSFGMDDKTEHAEPLLASVPFVGSNPLVQKIYVGSLLYMVSGCLEDGADIPLVGMERFMSGPSFLNKDELASVKGIASAFAAAGGQFVWGPTRENAPAGFRTASLAHGDFDNDEETLKSLIVA
jgi:hypothetical protein